MPRVLLTRPRAQSEATAAALEAAGWTAAIWPVIEIRNLLTAPLDWSGAQGAIFTSARGVEALAAFPTPTIPAYCVGKATAKAARAAGFAPVVDAQGDAATLAGVIAERAERSDGALTHVRGRNVSGDLRVNLEAKGFAVQEVVAYAAEAIREADAEIEEEILSGRLDAAAFYSPRSAGVFAALAPEGWRSALSKITAAAISGAAASPLESVGFRRIIIADRPDDAAMRAAICGAA